MVMVQEYADGGDLFNLLQKYGGCLSERIAVQMVLDPFLRVLQVRHTAQQCICMMHMLCVLSTASCHHPCMTEAKSLSSAFTATVFQPG